MLLQLMTWDLKFWSSLAICSDRTVVLGGNLRFLDPVPGRQNLRRDQDLQVLLGTDHIEAR